MAVMIIAGADLFRYRLDLVSPLRLSACTLSTRAGLLLRLTDEGGNIGWGEIAPLAGYSTESLDDATSAARRLQSELCQFSPSYSDISAIKQCADNVEVPSVRFGFECALLGLASLATSHDVSELLGNKTTGSVPVNRLLTGDKESVLTMARDAVSDGYAAVKLKTGAGSIDQNAELVRELSSILEGATKLRLDANRAWTLDEAVRFAESVEHCAIEYIEEPCRSLDDSLKVASDGLLPVALDESLVGLQEGQKRLEGVVAFVLKPTILGGITRAIELREIGAVRGIKSVISSTFESSIGLFYLASLAQSDIPAGLDTAGQFKEDLLPEPLTARNGRIMLPSVCIMRSIDVSRLEKL